MYISIDGKRYKCTGTPTLSGDPIKFYLPDGGPDTIGDRIQLCMDDGTSMLGIDTTAYASKRLDGNFLVLTNRTNPGPEPEPEPTPEEQMRADIDYIAAMTGVIL